jgi:hypothetical protein
MHFEISLGTKRSAVIWFEFQLSFLTFILCARPDLDLKHRGPDEYPVTNFNRLDQRCPNYYCVVLSIIPDYQQRAYLV